MSFFNVSPELNKLMLLIVIVQGNSTSDQFRIISGCHVLVSYQSELPRPIPQSDLGCTSRIYFDNTGDNVTLTLYNAKLASYNPRYDNNKCDCSNTNG